MVCMYKDFLRYFFLSTDICFLQTSFQGWTNDWPFSVSLKMVNHLVCHKRDAGNVRNNDVRYRNAVKSHIGRTGNVFVQLIN